MEYLCVTSEENWEVCEANNLWGVKNKVEFGTARNETIIKKVKEGDTLLIYVRTPVREAVALYEAKSQAYEDSSVLWHDGMYALRVKIALKNRISNVPYNKIISGVLKRLDGNQIRDRQDLRAEMIPLQEGSLAHLLNL